MPGFLARSSAMMRARSGDVQNKSVTQRVSQIVVEREDFLEPAKAIGRHRFCRGKHVERWWDARPRVWAPDRDLEFRGRPSPLLLR